MAKERFDTAKTASQTAVPGKEILVPLTASVYVAGRISEKPGLMVDLGTGYHLVKGVDETCSYCDRKSQMLDARIGETSDRIRKMTSLVLQLHHGDLNLSEFEEKAPQEASK
eukprot:Platyproteum_vivax@DN11609_c0_g1_i1.p1